MKKENGKFKFYADYKQKKGTQVTGQFDESPQVYEYVYVVKHWSSDSDELFPGINFSCNLSFYLRALIGDHVSFKDLKTARANILTQSLLNNLETEFAQTPNVDKEKCLREALQTVKTHLFHSSVFISMHDYIDPRLLVKFIVKNNLNQMECYYNIRLWHFHFWTRPWVDYPDLFIIQVKSL